MYQEAVVHLKIHGGLLATEVSSHVIQLPYATEAPLKFTSLSSSPCRMSHFHLMAPQRALLWAWDLVLPSWCKVSTPEDATMSACCS